MSCRAPAFSKAETYGQASDHTRAVANTPETCGTSFYMMVGNLRNGCSETIRKAIFRKSVDPCKVCPCMEQDHSLMKLTCAPDAGLPTVAKITEQCGTQRSIRAPVSTISAQAEAPQATIPRVTIR